MQNTAFSNVSEINLWIKELKLAAEIQLTNTLLKADFVHDFYAPNVMAACVHFTGSG